MESEENSDNESEKGEEEVVNEEEEDEDEEETARSIHFTTDVQEEKDNFKDSGKDYGESGQHLEATLNDISDSITKCRNISNELDTKMAETSNSTTKKKKCES